MTLAIQIFVTLGVVLLVAAAGCWIMSTDNGHGGEVWGLLTLFAGLAGFGCAGVAGLLAAARWIWGMLA